jgi:phage gpG-like protein
MLQLSFNETDQRVLVALRAKGPQIVQALLVKMNALMLRLQAKIVGEKLQGQVLHHRTGKLAGSIRAIPAVLEGTMIVGAVEGAGGPAFYGRIHEFGGVFNVKGHMVTQVFGKKVKAPHESKPYTATFPERSFMRTSLEEMRAQIFEGLTQAVGQELKK